jgi:8-oxo-dGTP diphosphatase
VAEWPKAPHDVRHTGNRIGGSNPFPLRQNVHSQQIFGEMAKSSKLVAVKRGKVLFVRRRRDRLWMFPGGRKQADESDKDCLRREIKEELPKLKLGRIWLWKEVTAKNRRSGRKMSDAIFVAKKATGRLEIGDKKEIDRAVWHKPRGLRLTPTSRYVRDKLFPDED